MSLNSIERNQAFSIHNSKYLSLNSFNEPMQELFVMDDSGTKNQGIFPSSSPIPFLSAEKVTRQLLAKRTWSNSQPRLFHREAIVLKVAGCTRPR